MWESMSAKTASRARFPSMLCADTGDAGGDAALRGESSEEAARALREAVPSEVLVKDLCEDARGLLGSLR